MLPGVFHHWESFSMARHYHLLWSFPSVLQKIKEPRHRCIKGYHGERSDTVTSNRPLTTSIWNFQTYILKIQSLISTWWQKYRVWYVNTVSQCFLPLFHITPIYEIVPPNRWVSFAPTFILYNYYQPFHCAIWTKLSDFQYSIFRSRWVVILFSYFYFWHRLSFTFWQTNLSTSVIHSCI